VLRYCLPG